jgi:uncharacterized membrane protein YfcA
MSIARIDNSINRSVLAMWNIILGIVFIIGGLTGKLALIGTNSPGALAVVGVLMLLYGIYQMTRKREEE